MLENESYKCYKLQKKLDHEILIAFICNFNSNLALETVEIPPQNVTSLQEHQQKVIEADVVQSEAPALTPAATQNLVSFCIYGFGFLCL